MSYRINLVFFLILLSILSLACSFFKGSTSIPLGQLIAALHQDQTGSLHQILFSIRLPRAFCAFVIGGLLALAGALMQILLRNPLADPYVLGVSGGAAVSTLLLLLLGVSGTLLTAGAWAGGLLTIFLVFILAQSNKAWNHQRTLLTGIACASGFSALISFILLMSPDKELRGMLFWLMGDLSYAHWPVLEGGILILGLIISAGLAPQLNILLRGEKEASSLGVNTQQLNIILYFISSGLTATAVTLGGCIGFIGLIVPHILRLAGLQDQRLLLPAAILLGGSLLTFADLFARTLWAPQQLPVGIMMAILGVPVFLKLMSKDVMPGQARGTSSSVTPAQTKDIRDSVRPTQAGIESNVTNDAPLDTSLYQHGTSSTQLLNLRNATLSISSRLICHELNLQINTGDIIGILGPNGSGKTTLLQTLIGLHPLDKGKLYLSQQERSTLSAKKVARQIGLLFQDTTFTFPQSVFEFCLAGRYPHLSLFSRETARDYSIARDALHTMELDHLAQQSIFSLSGGERRRLAIATLLTQNPQIFLLDEPTNHLDIRHQISVLNHFKQFVQTNSAAVIMSLHDANHAEQYCNKILLIFSDGHWLFGEKTHILTADNLSQLYSHPIHHLSSSLKYWVTATTNSF